MPYSPHMRARHLVQLLSILVLVIGGIGMTSSYTAAAVPEPDAGVLHAPMNAAASHCAGMAQGGDQGEGEDGHTTASIDCRAVCALILTPSFATSGVQMFDRIADASDGADIYCGVTLEVEPPPPRTR